MINRRNIGRLEIMLTIDRKFIKSETEVCWRDAKQKFRNANIH